MLGKERWVDGEDGFIDFMTRYFPGKKDPVVLRTLIEQFRKDPSLERTVFVKTRGAQEFVARVLIITWLHLDESYFARVQEVILKYKAITALNIYYYCHYFDGLREVVWCDPESMTQPEVTRADVQRTVLKAISVLRDSSVGWI